TTFSWHKVLASNAATGAFTSTASGTPTWRTASMLLCTVSQTGILVSDYYSSSSVSTLTGNLGLFGTSTSTSSLSATLFNSGILVSAAWAGSSTATQAWTVTILAPPNISPGNLLIAVVAGRAASSASVWAPLLPPDPSWTYQSHFKSTDGNCGDAAVYT